MGGRFSRTVPVVKRSKPVVKTDASPVKDIPPPTAPAVSDHERFYEPTERRNVDFEKKMYRLKDRVQSGGLVFFESSDSAAAEKKRRERREQRRRMLKGRLTTGRFKQVLIEQDELGDDRRDEWIQQLSEKYEVDQELLDQVLRFYRFPKLRKRYDGYLTADLWE